jgi:UPF0271 protein
MTLASVEPKHLNSIDLNCDMGELPSAVVDGTQETLLRFVTSANIACGGHAGDAQTIRTTVEQALRAGVAVGAHPGYADRENFGRLELNLPLEELIASIRRQVRALDEGVSACGASIIHVKPHGALYNQAVKNVELASAIAQGVSRAVSEFATRPTSLPVMVGLAGSAMLDVFRDAGFPVAAEAFADRRYEPDGTLRARKFDDALIHDPAEAAGQALTIAQRGLVIASDGSQVAIAAQTICIHGDTVGAPQIAAAIHRTLREAGITLRPLG